MAHYEDLSVCGFISPNANPECLAVGWLEPEHEFARGPVTLQFFERLCQLLVDPWTFVASGGVHRCGFCQFTGGGSATYKNYLINGVGNGLLFIPSGPIIYVSPTNIAHYIDAHGYRPPEAYQRAVMECPDMRSLAYLRALLATPARCWIKQSEKTNE